MSKTMTLRLSDDTVEQLKAVADVRGTPMAHAIRIAIARYLSSLTQDELFQAQVERRLSDQQRVLDRMAPHPDAEARTGT